MNPKQILKMALVSTLLFVGFAHGENSDTSFIKEQIRAYCGSNTNDTRTLKVIYFHPSDQEPYAGYQERIQRIMLDIQTFYREEMNRNGYGEIVFPLEMENEKLRIHVVKGKNPSKEYGYKSGFKVAKELQDALSNTFDLKDNYSIVFYALSDKQEDGSYLIHAPYYGDGRSNQRFGLCHIADLDVLDTNLLPENERTITYTEHTGTFTQTLGEFNTKYLGGTAHELGHGLGLPHNGQPKKELQKHGNALMGSGSLTYRNKIRGGKGAFLTFASATRLASHPLFTNSASVKNQPVQCAWSDFKFSTSEDDLVIEGSVLGFPEAYAAISYVDPEGRSDYDALTTVTPIRNGKFRIQAPCPFDGANKLKIVICHLNGATSKKMFDFTPKSKASELTEQWELQSVTKSFFNKNTTQTIQVAEAALKAGNLSETVIRKLKHMITLSQPLQAPVSPIEIKTAEAYLSDLQWNEATVGWGIPARNLYCTDKRYQSPLFLELGTGFYEKGLYAHAPSRYSYSLDGRFKRFTATVGLQKGVDDRGTAIFTVLGDGRILFKSKLLKGTQTEAIDVDISNINNLELIVDTGKDDNAFCWGVWGAPKISGEIKTINPLANSNHNQGIAFADVNHDQRISFEEFRVFGPPPLHPRMKQVFDSLDTEKQGTLNYADTIKCTQIVSSLQPRWKPTLEGSFDEPIQIEVNPQTKRAIALVTVNGVTGKFLVDTGTTGTLISEKFARKAKIDFVESSMRIADGNLGDIGEHLSLIRVPDMQIGGIHFKDFHAIMVKESTVLRSEFPEPFEGTIGANLLFAKPLTLDYRNERIWFATPKELAQKPTFKLISHEKTPLVFSRVDGIRVPLLFDSGAAIGHSLKINQPYNQALRKRLKDPTAENYFAHEVWVEDQLLFTNKHCYLRSFEQSLIGSQFFDQHLITIDKTNNNIWITPNPDPKTFAQPTAHTDRFSIPFFISESGHIMVIAKINQFDVWLIVDTAAGSSVIHSKEIKSLKLKTTINDGFIVGLGTSSMAAEDVVIPSISFGEIQYINPLFISVDLSHVEVASGSNPFHGLLGSPFLEKHHAIIDYKTKTISLKHPPQPKS